MDIDFKNQQINVQIHVVEIFVQSREGVWWKTNAKKCWPQSLGIWNESGSLSQVSAACGGLGRSAGLASAHCSHSGERRAVIISVRMHRINREHTQAKGYHKFHKTHSRSLNLS